MSAARELIRPTTRGIFRDLMTDSTYNEISRAFQDEGFAPDPECTWDDSSVRRTTAQQYLSAVNWTDPSHVTRALHVFERLLDGFTGQALRPLRNALRRDGYQLDTGGEITRLRPEPVVLGSMADLRDPAAIMDNLDRIQRAIGTDPAQAIGSAKELIESTAKTVLLERGLPLHEHDDLPALVRQAQQALDLHPSAATPGPDGSDAVKRILGSVTSLAIGVAELRNRGYATGHGAGSARVGLHARHAQLAVNAAITWCQLILDTLADTSAPWHSRSSNTAP